MRKAFASLAWLTAVAGTVVPWFLDLSAGALTTVSAVIAVLIAVAAPVALLVHRGGRGTILSVLVLVSVTAVAAALVNAADPGDQARTTRDVVLLAVQVLLSAVLLVGARRRLRADARAVIGDGLIVGLGSWIVLWVVLLQPSLNGTGGFSTTTLLPGATLAVLSVVLFLVATALFADTRPTPAVGFGTTAVLLTVAAEILHLVDARSDVALGRNFLIAPFLGAGFAAAGLLLHPSVRVLLDPSRRRRAPALMTRLVGTTASMVAPIILLALTDPADAGDRAVRAVSVTVLAVTVMARVVQSVRTNARTQEHLRQNAQTDPLTGLPNRTAMIDLVAGAMQDAWGTPRQPTVLFIDVDRFKTINDSLGHSAGDDVLLEVSRRLVAAVPHHAAVGRISGDEFVVLDPTTESATQAAVLAELTLDSLREPLALRQGDMFVSASIGVAMAVRNLNLTADEVLRHADTAMYRAKAAGRNCIAMFDDSMVEKVTQRLDIETALYRALEKNELRLVHQPIIDTSLNMVVGFEALMRWDRGSNGIVSPAEFIPIAEETGTIVPLGTWALLDALTHLREWTDSGACSTGTTISVNVSARQLHDPTFVSVVTEALSRSGVPAARLWLEVTESVMISEPTQALTALRQLNSIGVRIAIDDFGTGYSSLSLLQRFPIQRVKIDRAFVQSLTPQGESQTLVRTIIAMAAALGADVVAEGVETAEQLAILSALSCHKAQGYLISHPVPAGEVPSAVVSLEERTDWEK